MTKRRMRGQAYWQTLSITQRVALLLAHGGFSEKHADQRYDDLSRSLQELANEAAITPGGIVKLDRLIKLGVLNGKSFEGDRPTYWWTRCPSLWKATGDAD